MTTQPEAALEDNLVRQLQTLGYAKVHIRDEDDLLRNLKTQLEKHNLRTFTDDEFKQILNKISKGNIFEKAKTLREKIDYNKANGETGYIELINQIHWCKNQYQVAHQITMSGKYVNRYDVTLLINGLPLVQIELKRRGIELKEAFNQTKRYDRESFGTGWSLFNFLQLFVISNGVNTKYYANNRHLSFEQTFFWADVQNKLITNLPEFAETFLEPCHLSKMITKYMVLNTANTMMVLRPYQFYATEAIVERVKNTHKNGYIWHTTGSGKTLTSFKAAQILTGMDDVHKVVFVVDRKDLDFQTIREFNSFQDGSVDGTNNTGTLVRQLSDSTPLIVTTIQKLSTAIEKTKYLKHMEALRDKRVVFIFDECHRSQFGDTHKRIRDFFEKAQMFGFTGTPIFADNSVKNAHGKRTTKDLFDECLHKYVITDAIRDRNVLKFSIEYIRTFKKKDEGTADINVDDIDRTEVMEAPQRLENIVDYILLNHNRKTHNRQFTAIFAISNVQTLIRYYDLLKSRKNEGKHDLRIATIFSYKPNEDVEDPDGFTPDEFVDDENVGVLTPQAKLSREKLDEFIADFNVQHGTNWSTNEFYPYYKDVAKKVRLREIDVLLVVNMFLTGFDSKTLNTIYVDKNLRYHGLIQAFSRTNRILNSLKSQGNVVCFRNLKEATDEAITLFSNKEAIEEIIVKPYEDYIEAFNKAVEALKKIAPTIDAVNDLPSETEQMAFVQAFRELMRVKNVLTTFTEFSDADLGMQEQEFEDYKSKYLDLYERVKLDRQKEKVSILDDIDFELELIRRDEINVAYILALLAKLKDAPVEEQAKQRKAVSDLLASETQLRSKKELIERFIAENLPEIGNTDDVPKAFDSFWTTEKKRAIRTISAEENLDNKKLIELISAYLFSQKEPLRDEIIDTMKERPGLKDRASASQRIFGKVVEFVETFINGMG